MAQDSKILNIDDRIIVNVFSQITGEITFSSFSDVLVGLTAQRNVSREFRVTTDDIFFTDWKSLTNENLLELELISDGLLTIQVRYTRIGSDNTGEIEFVSIDFVGNVTSIEYNIPTILSSIFSSVVNDAELTIIEKNLFKKLYFRGILPDYILRNENRDKTEDENFIAVFSSVAKFFALMIKFFSRWENSYNDFEIMLQYIRENGIFVNESKIQLSDMQYLLSHYYDEIKKRGTSMIFYRKDRVLQDSSLMLIDGEFLRLLQIYENNELLTEVLPKSSYGWCLGKSSPLYKGTCDSVQLNKTKEISKDFVDINNFVTCTDGDGVLAVTDEGDKNVLRLSAATGVCGLGRFSNEDNENLYVVDTACDYEIVFLIRVNTDGTTGKLKFETEGFNSFKNKFSDSFIIPNYDLQSESFCNLDLSFFVPGQWYKIRGILYSYATISIIDSKLNINAGNNLTFYNKFTNFILPKIQLVNDSGVLQTIDIWNYKIRPLVRGKNIIAHKDGTVNAQSVGFIQSPKLFHIYAKNNNRILSTTELEKNIEKFLVPYDLPTMLTLL